VLLGIVEAKLWGLFIYFFFFNFILSFFECLMHQNYYQSGNLFRRYQSLPLGIGTCVCRPMYIDSTDARQPGGQIPVSKLLVDNIEPLLQVGGKFCDCLAKGGLCQQ